jgi:putative DNA primase/helicase
MPPNKRCIAHGGDVMLIWDEASSSTTSKSAASYSCTALGLRQESFADFLRSHGYAVDTVVPDRRLRRCHIEGDRRGSQNGWYILNTNGHLEWGVCGSHKTGDKMVWRGKATTPSFRSPPIEPLRIEPNRKHLESVWQQAETALSCHPYLQRKGVRSYGLRRDGGYLLIPVRSIDGVLIGIQRITPSGDKRFVKGSTVASGMHWIGSPESTILIAEGYATAASVSEATGRPSVAAFSASNLVSVAEAVRDIFPSAHIFLMADEDGESSNFAGQRFATEAARKVAGHVVLPSDVFGWGGHDA